MFDEKLIREHLCFNQKFGCIEDFEDLGRHGRTSNIANHGLVFMLRGLCKKWKHSVLYYLIHRSTMGEMLVTLLMEVFDLLECRTGSCHHVQHGCQQYHALKQLAVFEKTNFFRFYDQEIAVAFLILLFCLNAHAICSLNMMGQRLGLRY